MRILLAALALLVAVAALVGAGVWTADYLIHRDDTSSATGDVDHGDPPPPQLGHPRLQLAAPTPFVCVAASTPHIEAILVNPPTTVGLTVADVITSMTQANTYVNEAAAGGATMRVLCDATGAIAVGIVTANVSADFNSVIGAVRAAGYTRSSTRYAVFLNARTSTWVAGEGQLGSYGTGTYYAVSYGYAGGQVILHEITHTLGCCALGSPNSTGAYHTNDAYDVMSYNDGGPTGQQHYACSTTVYDCGKNDYAAVSPSPGSWLALHAASNVLSCSNQYFQVNDCAGDGGGPTTTSTTSTTSTSTSTTTTTVPPPPPPGLQPPTGLRVAIRTCTAIGIAWNPVTGAARYYTARHLNSGPWGTTYTVAAAFPRLNTSWSVNGAYDFRVRTVDAAGRTSDFAYLNGVRRAC